MPSRAALSVWPRFDSYRTIDHRSRGAIGWPHPPGRATRALCAPAKRRWASHGDGMVPSRQRTGLADLGEGGRNMRGWVYNVSIIALALIGIAAAPAPAAAIKCTMTFTL